MAITGPDLIDPKGEIARSLFPSDEDHELDERLEGWILEAQSKVAGASDEAQAAWAYYRAYRAVCVRLAAAPVAADLDDQGSFRREIGQSDRFCTLADQKLQEWEALTQNSDVSRQVIQPTGSIETNISW